MVCLLGLHVISFLGDSTFGSSVEKGAGGGIGAGHITKNKYCVCSQSSGVIEALELDKRRRLLGVHCICCIHLF